MRIPCGNLRSEGWGMPRSASSAPVKRPYQPSAVAVNPPLLGARSPRYASQRFATARDATHRQDPSGGGLLPAPQNVARARRHIAIVCRSRGRILDLRHDPLRGGPRSAPHSDRAALEKHHFRHRLQDPSMSFGVSSLSWDVGLGIHSRSTSEREPEAESAV